MARKKHDDEPNYEKWEHERGMRIIPPVSFPEAVRKEKEEMANKIGFEMQTKEQKEKQKNYKEWKKKHPDYFDVGYETLTESQEKIVEICDAIKDLLLYKNQKYGDSALHPNNIFYKGDSTNSIKIRLDDKVGRIKNCEETRVNDVSDLIGYSVLLLASMNVTKEDIAKFKD